MDIQRFQGVLVPTAIMFLSLTYVFFSILQFIRKHKMTYLNTGGPIQN